MVAGRQHTRERLAHFYRNNFLMKAEPLATGGFEVAITVIGILAGPVCSMTSKPPRPCIWISREIQIVSECRNGREVLAALKDSPIVRQQKAEPLAGKRFVIRDERSEFLRGLAS